MISLKKYLDMETDPSDLTPTPLLESYRSALLAMGKSGAQACPAVGSDLQRGLDGLGKRLAAEVTLAQVKGTEKHVEEQLHQWGDRTVRNISRPKPTKSKSFSWCWPARRKVWANATSAMPDTSVSSPPSYRALQAWKTLAQVRASLVQRATELRGYVDQMAHDSKKSVAQLRAEVSNYEIRLKTAENLALRDALTGLPNRRAVEDRMEWRIQHEQVFCVVFLDLNRFKQVNDKHGHPAGDSLLKQFSEELRSNSRPSDVVGRWGGDEFIMILDCDLAGAKAQVERMQKWVFGEYTVQAATGKTTVQMDASVGVVQWQPGETPLQVIERADACMYKDKELSRKKAF